MSDEKIGAIELFRHATQEIRWGKQQQWQLSYYAILLFGALHLLIGAAPYDYLLPRWALHCGFSILAFGALFIGAKVTTDFQCFLVKNRRLLKRIYQTKDPAKNNDRSYVTTGFIQIRGGDQLDVGPFKDKTVWVGVLLIQSAAAVSVQARAYIECIWQVVTWIGFDLLAVVFASGWSLWSVSRRGIKNN